MKLAGHEHCVPEVEPTAEVPPLPHGTHPLPLLKASAGHTQAAAVVLPAGALAPTPHEVQLPEAPQELAGQLWPCTLTQLAASSSSRLSRRCMGSVEGAGG